MQTCKASAHRANDFGLIIITKKRKMLINPFEILSGLQCLVSILKCMVEWSKDLYTNPHVLKAAVTNNVNNITESASQNDLNASLISTSENDLNATIDDPTQYEKVKQHKYVLEDGIRLFNQKPKKGMKYFFDRGIVENNLESQATFFHAENQRLDKTSLGEYLGDMDCKELMHIYVDLMNFSNMDFLKALRYFLEGFRLPGKLLFGPFFFKGK